VPATTLREVAESARCDEFTLSCDLEGAEVAMVEDELELLSARVRWIFMEIHDIPSQQTEERLVRSLDSAGFVLGER